MKPQVSRDSKISRRQLMLGAVPATVLSNYGHLHAQSATPAVDISGEDDAVEILKKAVSHLSYLETFEFSLETVQGSSTILAGFELSSVTGLVRRPSDFQATIKVRASVMLFVVDIVAVDGKIFIQDPLNGGAWSEIGSAPELVNMINPDWFLQLAMGFVENATITDRASNETLIEGTADLASRIGVAGSESEAGSQVPNLGSILATEPFDVAFWINDDNELIRAEIYGPIFAAESSDVVKRIELSSFDDPVMIEVPEL